MKKMTKSLETLSSEHTRHRFVTYSMFAFLVFLSIVFIIVVQVLLQNQSSQNYKSDAQEPTQISVGTTNPFGKSIVIERKNDTNTVLVPGGSKTLVVSGPFTVEAWIKPNISPANGTIISKTASISNPMKFMSPFQLSISQGKVEFQLQDVGSTTPGYPIYVGSNTVIDSNIWHHVAATVDTVNGVVRLYVDGLLSGETKVNRQLIINDPDRGMAIGSLAIMSQNNTAPQPSDFRNHFSGEIDEVRISNTVRYTGDGFTLPHMPYQLDANTLALYHFEIFLPFQPTVMDETGNNHGKSLGYIGRAVSDLNFYLENESFEMLRSNGQPKKWEVRNLDSGDRPDAKNTLPGAGSYSYKFSPAKNGTEQIMQFSNHTGQDEAISLLFHHQLKGEAKRDSVGVVVKVRYTDGTVYSTSKMFSSAHDWTQDKITLVTDPAKTYEGVKVIFVNNNPRDNSVFRVDNTNLWITRDASKNGLQSTPSSLGESELQLID